MEFLFIILVTVVLAVLLHLDDRRRGAAAAIDRSEPRDRDAERARADLLAAADALTRRPLKRAEPTSSDWEPRA